jgi:hypothetical protein
MTSKVSHVPDEFGIRGRIEPLEPSVLYRLCIMAGWLSWFAVMGGIGWAVWHYAPLVFDVVKGLK